MFCWRITKYNPRDRDEFGRYTLNTWTSYSDIGSIFFGEQLTYEKYLAIEQAYVNAILAFMKCINIDCFQVTSLEKKTDPRDDTLCSSEMTALFQAIKNNKSISKEYVALLAQLILRDKLWCKLEVKDMYVHFGYDFYMYIGVTNTCSSSIFNVENAGLFIEPYQSPYR